MSRQGMLRWTLLLLLILPAALSKRSPHASASSSPSSRKKHKSARSSSHDSNHDDKLVKKELTMAFQQSKLHSSSLSSSRGDAVKLAHLAPAVSVESILLPRRFPLKGLIRLICLGAIVVFLIECVASAGFPHIQTIWGLIYGADTHTQNKNVMPNDYRPSVADIHLSRLIASSTNELLPPISLPSAGPLLGLFSSLLVYVGSTLLLPRWFTAARVFLEYRKLPTGTSSAPSQLVKHASEAAVLVHIHDKLLKQEVLADQGDSGGSRLICPLQWANTDTQQLTSAGPSLTESTTTTTTTTTLDSHFSHPSPTFFDLNQCRFYFDVETGHCQDGGPLLHSAPLRDIQKLVGAGISQDQLSIAKARYEPYNRPRLATPTLREAFVARIASPLVVVQVLGKILSCLEEGMQSLLNFFFLGLRHLFDARQSISAARQMANEVQTNVQDTSASPVLILRQKTKRKKNWIPMTAGDLIPGDVFVFLRQHEHEQHCESGEGVVMPVDALLLAGQSLANEAVLTGESVPQSKTPLDFAERVDDDINALLDMDADRNSILFAGTTLVHCASQGNQTSLQGVSVPAHNQTSGVVCLALRTGTYSSKGQLLRTLKSSAHAGAISNPQSEKDALRLILSLSVFAIASCASLFLPRKGSVGAPVTTFRRIIQCTRILIAGIPSDLPLALSAVARSCSNQLRMDSEVICSEPGALLTAAYVDTVVFDKTGTLTADTQSVSKLIPQLPNEVAGVSEAFQYSQLAGCHSLIHLKASSGARNQIVGDPLDEAALQYSGWSYNDTAQYYEAPNDLETEISSSIPVRLWQIKSFPFDPQKRMSTAVVVLENADGSLQLLSLTKGSPDTVGAMYSQRKDAHFSAAYEEQRTEFEVEGYRSIAMGWKDLSGTECMHDIFPNGLSTSGIDEARHRGSTLHRSDFEKDNLEFGGFVRFDASIRPSSRRIIEELHNAGIRSIMLTGDAIDAAVTVASKVRLIRRRQVAILEVREDRDGESFLQWRFNTFHKGKNGRLGRRSASFETAPFSSASLRVVLERERLGKCTIATSGAALELLFEDPCDAQTKQFVDNLSCVSVIARATPKQKNDVISRLKHQRGHTVMMCGDGVNDVTAMKSASVAVALLNGFGDEKNLVDGADFDDERRRKKVESKLMGSQRQRQAQTTSNKRKEARHRLNLKIEKAQAEIRTRAAGRSHTDGDANDAKLEFKDAKDMLSATLAVVNEERKREKSLRSGGGDAARILAEERRKNNTTVDDDNAEPAPSIKPGEASLVAPFSCLHPSIDGVDSVLRAGVATAACALATQELIALNSLMTCFGMATLYRDGFRYGKHMSTVEIMLYVLVDQQRYKASCTPRPRLPKTLSLRPPESMFQPAAILHTVSQAGVNLITMYLAVRYARGLEQTATIDSKYRLQIEGHNPQKISKILSALAVSSAGRTSEDQATASLFRRPPFLPNYETNVVFILSILQNMLISLANHKGTPFYQSILESRPLTTISVATVGICVALIAETSPKLNTLLQLKVLPSRKSQAVLFSVLVLNILASNLVSRLFSKTDHTENVKQVADRSLAADLEERLLLEESAQNLRGTVVALAFLAYLAIEVLVKT